VTPRISMFAELCGDAAPASRAATNCIFAAASASNRAYTLSRVRSVALAAYWGCTRSCKTPSRAEMAVEMRSLNTDGCWVVPHVEVSQEPPRCSVADGGGVGLGCRAPLTEHPDPVGR